jgi:predicted Kef-type K+ transport protein
LAVGLAFVLGLVVARLKLPPLVGYSWAGAPGRPRSGFQPEVGLA